MQIDPAELKGRKIGRVLTKLGRVTRGRVHEALAIQKTRRCPLGQLLVELGYCTQRDVREALAGQAGMAFIDLQNYSLSDGSGMRSRPRRFRPTRSSPSTTTRAPSV